MKKKILPILSLFAISCVFAGTNRIEFKENENPFQNPGQGWAANSAYAPDYGLFCGAGYIRYDWSTLQPTEDSIDWERFEKDINSFAKKGLPFYFRIMTANFHSWKKYSSPEWLFLKGAKGYDYEGVKYKLPDGTESTDHVVPDFSDPIYLETHEKFIKALAKRYDGDPRIGGLDLGSYGNWGEWHCTGFKGLKMEKAPLEIRRRIADMYLKNFKKTDIFFMTDDYEVLEYALGKGKKAKVGMRRDGIGSPWHFNRWIGTFPYEKITRMGDVWKDKPVFFEFFCGVKAFHEKDWDIAYSCDWILNNHVSLVNVGPLGPQDTEGKERGAVDKVSRYAGARLVAKSAEVSFDGGKIEVVIEGENKGASRIYLPYKMKYELRDSSGQVVFEKVSSKDPRKILPSEFTVRDSFKVALKSGQEYSLSLRVYHTKKVFKDFRFAVEGLNEDGSLPLGKISLK